MNPAACSVVGCPADAVRGSSRCRTHLRAQKARSDARRPTARQRGYDDAWERTSKAVLEARPWCECPGCPKCRPHGGCRQRSTDTDHIDGLGPAGPRGHDWTNLRALCHRCHSHRTGRDQGALARP